MRNLMWICVALVAMFATGESLVCYSCGKAWTDDCWFPRTMTCNGSEFSCFSGELELNISRFLVMESRGCIPSSMCNKTETGTFFTIGYTFSKTCCNTDCCNGATSVQLPITASFGAALTAVWSSWAL